MADFPSSISVLSMDAATGFRIDGLAADSAFGFSIAPAGDVNGDGLMDFVVGARIAAAPEAFSGAAYVIFGGTTGLAATFDLATLDGTNGFVIQGAPAGVGLGFDVAAADIDGDGYGDLIVGAPFSDPGQAGSVYVVRGRADGFGGSLDLSAAPAGAVSRLDGEATSDRIGMTVGALGDFNGDGWDDFVVASPSGTRPGANSGGAYVVFGGQDGLPANVDLSTLDGAAGFEIFGAPAGSRLGASVSNLDFNGDGFADLMLAAPGAPYATTYYGARFYAGAVYVIYGSASTPASFDVNTINGSNGFRMVGGSFGQAGSVATGGGDFDGDGRDELVFAHNTTIHVLYGSTGQPATTDVAYGMGSGFTLTGASQPRLAGEGDIDGDGFDDLIVSDANMGGGAGAAYVIFGGSALTGTHDLDDLVTAGRAFRIDGPGSGTGFGWAPSFVGDLNGDGADELALGAPTSANAGVYSGTSYIIWGRPSEISFVGGAGDDVRSGGGLGDDLAGADGADTLSGLGGDDALDGGEGNDLLYGGAGLDDLLGGLGHDLLDGGADADAMAGGAGDDTYIVDHAGDTVTEAGSEGSDRVRATVSFIMTGAIEKLVLEGTGDIDGFGNLLSNVIDGNAGRNYIEGDNGDDLIRGAGGDDVLSGGFGADHLLGGGGGDTLDGFDGNDRLDGGDGHDGLLGGDGADILDGGAGADNLQGEAGADQLFGGADSDQLWGGSGNDVLNGGQDVDSMFGGTGDDTYFVDSAGDLIEEYASEGTDQVRTALTYALGDNLEVLILTGAGAVDGTGNGLANTLNGNDGANVLDGLAGADILKGGLGADTLIGGLGNDILLGGLGADSFVVRQESVFSSLVPGGRFLEVDTVSDYASGDRIDLSAIDAVAGGGDDAFTLVGAFSSQAGEMTLTFAGGTTTLRLDTDGDGQADYMMKINGDVTGDSGGWAL